MNNNYECELCFRAYNSLKCDDCCICVKKKEQIARQQKEAQDKINKQLETNRFEVKIEIEHSNPNNNGKVKMIITDKQTNKEAVKEYSLDNEPRYKEIDLDRILNEMTEEVIQDLKVYLRKKVRA